MKRKLAVIFLVIAMTICSCTVLFSCGDEEHEHTYSDGWLYDTTTHWQLTDCTEHDVQKGNEAAHKYSGSSTVCTVCGYNNHDHTTAIEWTGDDFGHWHAFTCCPEVLPTVDPHTGYESDGICDVCHLHVHTHGTEYQSDATGHWYRATCEHTDHKVRFSAHGGLEDDCKCDVCGYADHKASATWEKDEDEHWQKAGCDAHKGQRVNVGEHDYDPSTYACRQCGYKDPSKTPIELPKVPA